MFHRDSVDLYGQARVSSLHCGCDDSVGTESAARLPCSLLDNDKVEETLKE